MSEPFEGFGFFYNGEFQPADQVAPPPASPYRAGPAGEYPYHHNSFWNTPVGSGLTYHSTGSAIHTATLTSTETNLNYNNWTDPIYYATSSDPQFTVEKRQDLPSGWSSVGNTQTGPTTGQGALQETYTGIYIPANATWQSTTNTDRKVIVVQPDITFQDSFYPAGTLAIEMHKFYRVTGGGLILTTNLSHSDLRGYGMGYGALASGVAMSQGYIRRSEWDAAAAGDEQAIRHALKIGLPNSKLKAGQVWPASHQDGDAGSAYSGQCPMGSMMVYDAGAPLPNVSNQLTGTTASRNVARAIAWTMQNFGAYVLIRAGNGPIVFGVESTPPHLTFSHVTEVRTNLTNFVLPNMRIASNSSSVGSLHDGGYLHRTPTDISRIAGGGTRNEALRPLPITPDGPWV